MLSASHLKRSGRWPVQPEISIIEQIFLTQILTQKGLISPQGRGDNSRVIRPSCPQCGEADYKKNGKTHYRKQNYQCRHCGREFVMELDRKPVSQEQKKLVNKLLLERISLRGICRVA